jgi:hypothetical protein
MKSQLCTGPISLSNRCLCSILCWSLMLGFAVAQTSSISEQETRQPAWGTSEAPNAADIQFETSIGSLEPAVVSAPSAPSQFGSGGVGLRNRGAGSIAVSGVLPPVQAAYIYWAVITSGPASAANQTIKLQRLSPTPASTVATITGTNVGTGPSPCWAATTDTITVFRGVVPTTVATGNGVYQVTLLKGASGSTAGGDPWVGTPILPLMEGASLVIIGTGTGTQRVVIYDEGLSGKTFKGNSGISYSLLLPIAASGKLTLFESIGADGQQGVSRLAVKAVADETTVINGVHIAGPGSNFNDSDWNGSSARPLPQLWDDVGHDITAATPAGKTTLDVSIANGGKTPPDCMTPVANVVQVQ